MNNMKPIEILLVEDNEDDIILTKEAFEENRLTNKLNIVKNGMDALRYLKRDAPYSKAVKPNIVLLDINLPEMSGIEVLQKIKSEDDLKDIPVVILTTSNLERDIVKSYKLHANCYINKPVNLNDFFEIIKVFGKFWFSIVTLPDKK
ncbi:response regulator [Sporomusa termitida]|uniref:Response regulator rcp1 n=1 Tax=Sporomusa termitida TaxID=2377 RepID=A0A517DQK0_9FIRM|nr:response regulator [Sporomusa termitida]QDR79634.1 Response regulator rcp1 [Sporomusa termitida]